MEYLTDRKRAQGIGSAKAGTRHFFHMQITAVALAFLVPLFLLTFGGILGAPHAEVVAYFSRPFPSIVAGLTIVVGFIHFRNGAQVMIEDYTQGEIRWVLIVGTAIFSYACIAAGLFALVRLAL